MYETGKEQFNAEDKKSNQGLNKNYIIVGIELKTSNHCTPRVTVRICDLVHNKCSEPFIVQTKVTPRSFTVETISGAVIKRNRRLVWLIF